MYAGKDEWDPDEVLKWWKGKLTSGYESCPKAILKLLDTPPENDDNSAMWPQVPQDDSAGESTTGTIATTSDLGTGASASHAVSGLDSSNSNMGADTIENDRPEPSPTLADTAVTVSLGQGDGSTSSQSIQEATALESTTLQETSNDINLTESEAKEGQSIDAGNSGQETTEKPGNPENMAGVAGASNHSDSDVAIGLDTSAQMNVPQTDLIDQNPRIQNTSVETTDICPRLSTDEGMPKERIGDSPNQVHSATPGTRGARLRERQLSETEDNLLFILAALLATVTLFVSFLLRQFQQNYQITVFLIRVLIGILVFPLSWNETFRSLVVGYIFLHLWQFGAHLVHLPVISLSSTGHLRALVG